MADVPGFMHQPVIQLSTKPVADKEQEKLAVDVKERPDIRGGHGGWRSDWQQIVCIAFQQQSHEVQESFLN